MNLTKMSTAVCVCFSWLFVVAGCQDGADRLSSDALSAAALGTHARYVKMRNTGETPPSDDIPEPCWTDEIRALRPLKVYLHRINVVVVQKAVDCLEEGKYIQIDISSYIPQSGDDGFTFTNQRGCVHDFRRSVHN